MKITTVRITDEMHEWVRENRPQQLSAIVRDHLEDLMHRETPVDYHNAFRENAQKCYPHMRGGYCAICWPAGIPSKKEWAEYIRAGLVSDGGGNTARIATITYEEWIMRKHGARQSVLEEWNREEAKKPSRRNWVWRMFFRSQE
jgi:hypothetical protein